MRFFKKDGLIFAAGVICGVFMKTVAAQNWNISQSPASFVDSLPSSEEIRLHIEGYIQKVKDAIELGLPAPKLPTKVEGVVVNPECFMTVPEMIRDLGYICEEHEVITADGYKLGLHRIPFSRDRDKHLNNNEKKPVVFLQHGLLADSASWTVNGANASLAFILADKGYDVWLGNVRGNTYSRSHLKWNPDVDKEFWKFSWQEISHYDLPSMVDHALEISGQKQLYYIGHSQGTLIMFTQLASNPAFNEKVKTFFALGPVFNLQHINSPIKKLVPLHGALHFGQQVLGLGELLPSSETGKWLVSKMHGIMSNNEDLIYHGNNLMFFLSGFRPWRYWKDKMPVYMAHTPAGTSVQNILHFAQMIQKRETLRFDFGTSDENSKEYGCDRPPGFELQNITAPVALFWGSEDNLADPDDVLSIIPYLKSIIHAKQLKDWDHLEYIWGKFAVEELYSEIVKIIENKEAEGESSNTIKSEL